jgi:cysteine desulfurase family protein (TIGR01976 family)
MSTAAPASSAEALQKRFPALAGPVVRLDGPSGSQVPQSVIDAIGGYLATSNANLGGSFEASIATGELFADARQRVARFFGTDDGREVGFGLNASTLNAALVQAATAGLSAADEIIVTALDHHANTAPWHRAAAERDLVIRTVGVDADGRLDKAQLNATLGERTRIVAFPYANNALGTMVDVAGVAAAAHRVGAIAWGDPTHYAPHGPLNVRELGVDVAFCSAYKFFGPHLGLFYARGELLRAWAAVTGDATDATQFEYGTPPLESLAGLVAAFDYLDEVGWEFITAHERDLGARFLAGLPEPWQLRGLPDTEGRTATYALTLPGAQPPDLAQALAKRGIAVGAGRFHSPDVFQALGLAGGAIRIGFLHYNTSADVDAVLTALSEIAASRP